MSRNLRLFFEIVSRYFPDNEVWIENNGVCVKGYLAKLLKTLLQIGYALKFTFLNSLVEYVRLTEAMKETEKLIHELVDSNIIYEDPKYKDLFRITEQGMRVLKKVQMVKKDLEPQGL
jgi:hypothetical protein